MEDVLLKVRCQSIADFYGKNVTKWKTFTTGHFKKMECKIKVIYRVMQLVVEGESLTQKENCLS